MKKTLLGAYFLVLLVLGSGIGAQVPVVAQVTKITGKAQVQKGADWIPLSVGQTLTPGDTISTGFRSELLLQIGPSVVTVKPLSRLTLQTLIQTGTELQTDLYLRVGKIDAQVNKSEVVTSQKFNAGSPVATASVRGTSFSFDTINLEVTRGLVNFTDFHGNTVSVPLGEAARASLPETGGGLATQQELVTQESVVDASAGSEVGQDAATADDEELSFDDWDYGDLLEYLDQYYWEGDLPITHLYIGGIIADGAPLATIISIGGITP